MKPQYSMDDINVTDDSNVSESMTDLQVYGINKIIVTLLSNIRKYTILSQIQLELKNKPNQIHPIMREIYQFREMEMIMDIRANFDTFYVYTKDKIVIKNVENLREKFEYAINFLTTNMQSVESVLDKNYVEILDTFSDRLKLLANDVATKSIFDEHFKLS